MSNSEVGQGLPRNGAGIQGALGSPGVAGPSFDAPRASVREVPAAQEPEEVRYRYVARPAPGAFHIWEEVTGERVTTAPIMGEHQAEETVLQLNRINSPPR